MTIPNTAEAARAAQEHWQKRLNAYDAALAEVRRLSDERDAHYEAMVKAAEEQGKEWPSIPYPTPEYWAASEAWADAQKDLPDPDLARQYAALLDAHAEALEQGRWIPVEERLPENEDERVLVATQVQKVVGVQRSETVGFFYEDGRGGYFLVHEGINGSSQVYGLSHLHNWQKIVTHWQALPALPPRAPTPPRHALGPGAKGERGERMINADTTTWPQEPAPGWAGRVTCLLTYHCAGRIQSDTLRKFFTCPASANVPPNLPPQGWAYLPEHGGWHCPNCAQEPGVARRPMGKYHDMLPAPPAPASAEDGAKSEATP